MLLPCRLPLLDLIGREDAAAIDGGVVREKVRLCYPVVGLPARPLEAHKLSVRLLPGAKDRVEPAERTLSRASRS